MTEVRTDSCVVVSYASTETPEGWLLAKFEQDFGRYLTYGTSIGVLAARTMADPLELHLTCCDHGTADCCSLSAEGARWTAEPDPTERNPILCGLDETPSEAFLAIMEHEMGLDEYDMVVIRPIEGATP